MIKTSMMKFILRLLLIGFLVGILITTTLHFFWLLFTSPRRIGLAFCDLKWWWKKFKLGGL